MHQSRSGFTIVELLIVVVVIAILAAITIVSYNGITTRAENASRADELLSWRTAFIAYKGTNGTYPVMSDTAAGYCLGTDFPNGKCRDYTLAVGVATYAEAASAPLVTELQTISKMSGGSRKGVSSHVGPYVEYGANQTNIVLRTFLQGGSGTCQSFGLTHNYAPASGAYSICQIVLE